MNEFERNRDIAIVVSQQAARVVVLAVCAGTIDLDVAYQISCLAESEQPKALQQHLEPPVEKTLLEKFQAMWAAASPEERKQSAAGIADFIAITKEEKPKSPGVLFPDAEEERQQRLRTVPTKEEFEAFWKAYPRRVDKTKARVAFTKAFKLLRKTMECEQVITTIMTGVGVYATHADPAVLCYPTTWLNGCRWEDEADGIRSAEKDPRKRSSAQLGTYSDEKSVSLQDAVF